MLYVREYMEYKPWGACRILVVVRDNGKAEVEDYLDKIIKTHPKEIVKIAYVLKRAALAGPRSFPDDGVCKIVGEVGEFKAKGYLLRVFWFFAASVIIDGQRIDTIVLTHAARPNKGQEQSREIQRAERIAAEYRHSPFPLYKEKK